MCGSAFDEACTRGRFAELDHVKQKGTAMKFMVTMDRDEDGVYVVECPSIPGCISQGSTEEEALRNIRDAIRECLEVRKERKMPLTIPTREIEVSVG